MCQHFVLFVTHATCFDPVLGHHQVHDEYKLYLTELCLNSNMDLYYVLTSFLYKLFGINSQAITFKLKLNLKINAILDLDSRWR
jgi:hypothetical protein